MNRHATKRDVIVGMIVVAALGGFLALLSLAGGGPGFLTARRNIDVIFRDGQGLRPGSAVRVAGIDAGRVTDIDLIEYEGSMRARVRIALPTYLAKKLRQDVKVTIQPNLTGQSRVNIVSSGRSNVALVPGQIVQGVETTFFDPILDQVGLGPVERSHISHVIEEVRDAVDAAAPRLREILASLDETASSMKDLTEQVKPAIVGSVANVEDLTKRINGELPKLESTLKSVESIASNADNLIAENRISLRETLATIHDLTATINDMTLKNRPKLEQFVDGMETTRRRADRVLYQTDILVSQGVQMVTQNKADVERTVANVRDATDWANKLVQKIFANPFVLSPFYKPTPEDKRALLVYDTALMFTKGAQELDDSIKRLDSMKARATTAEDRQQIAQLERQVAAITEGLQKTSQLLAEGLQGSGNAVRVRR